jgi:hypothetical protein
MLPTSSQSGFVAFAAVGFTPLGGAPARGHCKLAHTHQFKLGKLDHQGCFRPQQDAQWTVKNPGNGSANIDLGNYELQLDEKNSQIKIVNKNNGEVTNIWGDPHIDWNKDGKTDADFWGKTTFQLEDGTKITIDTEPFKNNPDMAVSSEVTVTRGDNALKITGLSQNELGDLKIESADRGGQALDWAVTDGFTVKENANGTGWVNPDTGKLATQGDFDITKPGTAKPYEFTQDFGQALGLYLMSGMFSGGLGLLGQGGGGWEPGHCHTQPQPPARPGLPRAHVHQPDAHTVRIHHRSGAIDTRSGGSLAWRTNNPGLLPFNPTTRHLGAIGAVNGVAVFPSEDSGRSALLRLLCGHSR